MSTDLYDDYDEPQMQPPAPAIRAKKQITEKQKKARIANLAAGRAKAAANKLARKQGKPIDDEFESESSSDEDIVITKQPKQKQQKHSAVPHYDQLRQEMADIKMAVGGLLDFNKKMYKKDKRRPRPPAVVVNVPPTGEPTKQSNNSYLDEMRRRLMS
jgi:hypothetical protein